jgi:CAI-1 autoinducer synthase
MPDKTAAPHRGRPSAESRWGEISSLSRRIDQLWANHLYPPVVVGSTPCENAILLSSNDYLALSNDKRIVEAQIASLKKGDNEIFMSGVYAQYLDQQRDFESEIAEQLGAEDVALCQSGYAANEGLIQALADVDTPVYIDMQAHASLWQGAQNAGAPVYPVRHNNAQHLRSLTRKYGPGIVAVDAIYSTVGSVCRLAEIVEVCEASGSLLVVDESHSIGVVGEKGEGLVSSLGMADRVPYRTFSLSKALVGRAGIVMGPRRVMEFFRGESRPAIFSSAVMGWEIARFVKTWEIVRAENWRRDVVWRNAAYLRDGLESLGYNMDLTETPIIPIEAGPEESTKLLRDTLEQAGVFGAVFSGPATPANRCIVRLCVNAAHTTDDLDRVLAVCDRVREDVGMADWASTRRRKGRSGNVRSLPAGISTG